ncbi:MAG: histidine phosphatase family protein [Burkholderiales bacterium]|nr:histidine phosphatase family protein [Burkholderiales bacterium]
MIRRVALLAFLGFALGALAAESLSPEALVAELRNGGYILYFRHTSTDFSQNDSKMTSFEDCASQRNLTDRGREEARRVGEHVRRLAIPVGEVLASPFCRTMETAMLAFGKATRTQEVRGGPARSENPKRYEPLRQLLSKRVPNGANLVIASHGNPFHAVTGMPYLAEGEAAVVRPRGDGRFDVIARIRLEDWAALR